MPKKALAVHGGAGTILKSLMTAEIEAEYRSGLEAGLRAGWNVLQNGGSSLDAVEAAVVSLEDFPLFNAGRGSSSPTTARTKWTRRSWTAGRWTPVRSPSSRT